MKNEHTDRLRGTVSRDGMVIFRNVTPALSVTPGDDGSLIFRTEDTNGKAVEATLLANGDFMDNKQEKKRSTAFWMSRKLWRTMGVMNPLRNTVTTLRQEIGRIVVQDRRLLDATKRVIAEAKEHKGRPSADAMRKLETAFSNRFGNSPNNSDTYYFFYYLRHLLSATEELLDDGYLRAVIALTADGDDETAKKIKGVRFALHRLRESFPFVDDPPTQVKVEASPVGSAVPLRATPFGQAVPPSAP